MATEETELQVQKAVPPYGPTRGMLQALEMLRKTTPSRIDSDFLRDSGVAPGNEYKVAGALKFLGLVDESGRPTEKSRLLKTKGDTYSQTLKEIVRTAYADLFQRLDAGKMNRDEIYNYFVTEGGLGAEMANKATRFFVKLCELAGIDLGSGESTPERPRGRKAGAERKAAPCPGKAVLRDSDFPLVLTLTPDTADMDVDRLTELFRKMRTAWERSQAA